MSEDKLWVPSDPFIAIKKTSFMQRLSDRVRRGATHYICGQTALKSVPNLTSKLSKKWPLNLTKMQASRRRKAGHGTYHWLGWLDDQTQVVNWFVLLNPGDQIDPTESWRCVINDRIHLTGYELVRHTRTGSSAPAWTWRYTRDRMETIRHSIVSAIRGRRDVEAEQIIHSLYRSPGFAGVREQVKKMRLLLIGEWNRNRSAAEVIFEIPRTIGYVSRLSDRGSSWSDLMATVENSNQKPARKSVK